MKIIKTGIFLVVIGLVALQSCKKFDSINSNPNSSTTTTASLLATNLILNITRAFPEKNFLMPSITSKQIAWAEVKTGEQYNYFGSGFTGDDFVDLEALTNVQKMIDVASSQDKKAYTGLGMFIKAYKLYYLSLKYGDVPYSEALSGETGNVHPKYDPQKEVMMEVLKDLETADTAFAGAANFAGDPIFGGNSDNWRRVVNSFRLKVLISLSRQESDPDLRLKETFSQIFTSEPILQSNDDNLQLPYSDQANQLYPFNSSVNKYVVYAMISSGLIDSLKKYNDYRLFYYASPSKYATVTEGKAANDYDAYLGTDVTLDYSEVVSLFNAGKYSRYNLRYTDYAPGEPQIRVGFAEQDFIIAEAIIRGWITGNAKEYYEDGITQSMNFIVKYTPDDVKYNNGRKITSGYISSYLVGPYVAFSDETDTQLKQIWEQKYLMYFMQYPYDAYFDNRRTDYPVLPVDPQTSTNPDDKSKLPMRYLYPSSEYNYNLANLKAALDRQYNGDDKSNGIMWILK